MSLSAAKTDDAHVRCAERGDGEYEVRYDRVRV